MELEQDVQTPMSGSFGGSGRKISVGMNSDSGGFEGGNMGGREEEGNEGETEGGKG